VHAPESEPDLLTNSDRGEYELEVAPPALSETSVARAAKRTVARVSSRPGIAGA